MRLCPSPFQLKNIAVVNSSAKNPKPSNIALKGPSNSRMRTQAIIQAAKEKSMAARLRANTQLTLQFDEDRNKTCHYCGNTFYYTAGLKTHIEHAHRDIISIKGIDDPDPTQSTSVKGANSVNTNLPAALLGSNIAKIGSARAKDVNTADDSRSSGSILG